MAYYSHSALSAFLKSTKHGSSTSIGLLKLTHPCGSKSPLSEGLVSLGDDILSHIADPHEPTLQVLFLSSIRINGCTTGKLEVTRPTLEQLCFRLGISLAFLDGVLVPSIWSKTSSASFHRYGNEGEVRAIDGFYHYFNDWRVGPLHAWFSYDVKSGSATYVLVDCPDEVREKIIENTKTQLDCFLHQPFAIDYLISEQCALWREKFIEKRRMQIFDWHEQVPGSMDPPLRPVVTTPEGLQKLHQLSRSWNMIFQDLNDFEERLDFLMEAAGKLDAAGMKPPRKFATKAFLFLKSRNSLRRRWVTSFGERTKLIMNFVFSIASQSDNQTNLRIANLTADIAEETQKDSSSMISIATMTMLFLPATFVCAIFSMVFFHDGIDSNGQETFAISSYFWLFPTLTLALTLLVFIIYRYWGRRRDGQTEERWRRNLREDPEKGSELHLGWDLEKGSELQLDWDLEKESEFQPDRDLERGSELQLDRDLEKGSEPQLDGDQ